MATETRPGYSLEHSTTETDRLLKQAQLYELSTERLLQDAGLTTGMRVLDLGSGAGDVALLAGRLVGPTGTVLGVDRNIEHVTLATERAATLGAAHVSFVAGDLHELTCVGEFDAVIGRLVLCHMPDPVETLRVASRYLRPGGLAIFQELNLEPPHGLKGASPRLKLEYQQLIQGFTRAGIKVHMGMELFRAFTDAGFEAPYLTGYTALGGRPDWLGFEVTANVYRTMTPLFEQFGVTSGGALGVDSMAARIRTEVGRYGLPFVYATFIGAWARRAGEGDRTASAVVETATKAQATALVAPRGL
jgi:ubiquinone/menaquinone biosynthesis C-methylase UbiE